MLEVVILYMLEVVISYMLEVVIHVGGCDFIHAGALAFPRGTNYSSMVNRSLTCLGPLHIRAIHTASYTADVCPVVRIYWAWSILLMICTPYIFVFLKCLWRILFKTKKNPDIKTLLLALIIETLHTIGLCLLMFMVLPSLDNTVQALMFLLGVGVSTELVQVVHFEQGTFLAIVPHQEVSVYCFEHLGICWPVERAGCLSYHCWLERGGKIRTEFDLVDPHVTSLDLFEVVGELRGFRLSLATKHE